MTNETQQSAETRGEAPLVTIGITNYNAAATLRRAIESATAQTIHNREIVVVDDASTDHSVEIAKKLQGEHSEIRVIQHEKNLGYAGALNTLIKNARGQYIAFFDSDDESNPNRLELQINRIKKYKIEKNTSNVVCYTGRRVTDADTIEHTCKALGSTSPEPYGEMVAEYILGLRRQEGYSWGMFGSCTMLVETSTVVQLNGFDEQFRRSAEMDFAVRAAKNGAHFISVDEPLITQFKTKAGYKTKQRNREYWMLLLKKHRSYLEQQRAYPGMVSLLNLKFALEDRRWLKTTMWAILTFLLVPLPIARRKIWSIVERVMTTCNLGEK